MAKKQGNCTITSIKVDGDIPKLKGTRSGFFSYSARDYCVALISCLCWSWKPYLTVEAIGLGFHQVPSISEISHTCVVLLSPLPL